MTLFGKICLVIVLAVLLYGGVVALMVPGATAQSADEYFTEYLTFGVTRLYDPKTNAVCWISSNVRTIDCLPCSQVDCSELRGTR